MNGVEQVREALSRGFPEATIEVWSFSPTHEGDHVEARIVSALFCGKTLVDRHRMVYAALGDAFTGTVHALTFRALTPQENNEEPQ